MLLSCLQDNVALKVMSGRLGGVVKVWQMGGVRCGVLSQHREQNWHTNTVEPYARCGWSYLPVLSVSLLWLALMAALMHVVANAVLVIQVLKAHPYALVAGERVKRFSKYNGLFLPKIQVV